MNKLNKLASFGGVKGPVLTIVMDGVGIAPDTAGNAVSLAYTPTLDRIMKEYPMVSLKAHGTAVGLPSDDDMGNSEVGHNALGAGQVFAQRDHFPKKKRKHGSCLLTAPPPYKVPGSEYK